MMDGQPSFLGAYLSSLAPILEREDLVEIAINPDGKVWIERRGGSHRDWSQICRSIGRCR